MSLEDKPISPKWLVQPGTVCSGRANLLEAKYQRTNVAHHEILDGVALMTRNSSDKTALNNSRIQDLLVTLAIS